MRQRNVYYADFETTAPGPDCDKVRVYLWVIVRGDYVQFGDSIESFIDWCLNNRAILFFHNLKFDFSYIQYYLIENHYDYNLLEKKGTIYSAQFEDVEFRDSLNFLPMTLREVGENYCSKYKKTSIDYCVPYNHKPTQEEIDYCINDCRVLEEGLTNYLDSVKEVLSEAGCVKSIKKVDKKLTNAGIAFEAFKEMSNFEKLCPKTTLNEYNLFSPAYKGGYVYSNPRGIMSHVQMIDCNSMYPSKYATIEMPYGHPIVLSNYEECLRFNFFIIGVRIKYELKPGFIPTIGGGVGKYGNAIYKSSSFGEFEELTICNYDFELIQEYYDIEWEFSWGCGFKTEKGFFEKYCNVFLEIKNKNKGIKRQVAKVFLNSPYGKTAMNGMNEIKQYLIKDGSIHSEIVGYECEDKSFQYLPMAIAITGSARQYLLNTACQIGFSDVHYMDTDSIKFNYKETGLTYDDHTLGAWKDEGLVKYFKTIAPKKYIYYTYDGMLNITCAGFNKKVLAEEMHHSEKVDEVTALKMINRFSKGLELSCLQSKLITGGRALLPVKKEMK